LGNIGQDISNITNIEPRYINILPMFCATREYSKRIVCIMFKNKINFKRQDKYDKKIFKTNIYIFTRVIDIFHIIGFNVALLHKLYEQIHKIMLDDVMTLPIFHILSKRFYKKIVDTSSIERNGKEIHNFGHEHR